MLTHRRTLLTLAPAIVLAVGTACGGGDELQSNEDHTPRTYELLINDLPVAEPYTFVADQTVHVRIKFFNQAGEDLDEVEAGHFARLTFDPVTLATAVRRDDHHFQFDVAGGTPGNGSLVVGYGHDDFADEVTFSPEPVQVTDAPEEPGEPVEP